MAQNLSIRILDKNEYMEWDGFVKNSPQGSLFSSIMWLEMYGEPYKIFASFKGKEMVGGAAIIEDGTGKNTSPLVYFTPYQGILYRDNGSMNISDRISLEKNIAVCLIEELEKIYRNISLYNHWNFKDARAFYWHCYGRVGDEYVVTLRYTSVIDISDIEKAFNCMDDDTRYEIRKAEKNLIKVVQEDDFVSFDRLHDVTFKRQGIERPEHEEKLVKKIYEALKKDGRCKIYFAKTKEGVISASAMIIWDNKRAYYMFGATDPETRNNGATSLLLWTIFKELCAQGFKEIDLVGVNSPNRGRFKMGFGGALIPYLLIQRKRS